MTLALAVAAAVLEVVGFALIIQSRRARRLLEAAAEPLERAARNLDHEELARGQEMVARAERMLHPWRRVPTPSGSAALERDGEVVAVACVLSDGSFDPPLTVAEGETLVILDDPLARGEQR